MLLWLCGLHAAAWSFHKFVVELSDGTGKECSLQNLKWEVSKEDEIEKTIPALKVLALLACMSSVTFTAQADQTATAGVGRSRGGGWPQWPPGQELVLQRSSQPQGHTLSGLCLSRW